MAVMRDAMPIAWAWAMRITNPKKQKCAKNSTAKTWMLRDAPVVQRDAMRKLVSLVRSQPSGSIHSSIATTDALVLRIVPLECAKNLPVRESTPQDVSPAE
jgi:hypothetical protein